MAKKSVKNIKKQKPEKGQKKLSKDNDEKLFAFLATFLSIIGFLIALIAKKNNRYVMYYAKQSLIVFLIGVLAGILGSSLKFIPIIGQIINFALGALVVLAWALTWIYALSGKEEYIPIISEWAEKINL